MIQRIQSIFLLITAILMAVTLFCPLIGFHEIDTNETWVLFSSKLIYNADEEILNIGILLILLILGTLLPIVNIFLYNKRKVQIKIAIITSVIILLAYAMLALHAHSIIKVDISNYEVIPKYGSFLPIIALIFNILAISKIRKDEKLIQSLNRIR